MTKKPKFGVWQPIETAPRDQLILGFGEAAGEIHGPSGKNEIAVTSYGGPGDYPGYEWDLPGDAYAIWFKPTHWMPLPPEPVDAPPPKQ